mmetsp:Transcript_5005/g.12691  ORF Transcript_5005/g.12691 Transcript_5005/m.12691 type:complete len:166 (+) Transcript_5005:205-702(+)|eukprot:CAMPEP_0113471738 /NCGR_PEP_ID=MMETSP0014_2-20120614/17137_1 /TAXON_ID=2857 /ORGANISM="Nitzschia sp." /LENGTH=165 /DNA_ID=CAMNT_0000364391 /DNA_START=204 /DNA_END=701 /DNA_ORIENTATION=+ /assembly_acc=CAM_ASM_000159
MQTTVATTTTTATTFHQEQQGKKDMTVEDFGSDTSHTQPSDYDYDYDYDDDDEYDDDDFESWDRYDELGHNFEGRFDRACTSSGGGGANSGTGRASGSSSGPQSIYSSKHVRIKLARTDTVTVERTNHQKQKKSNLKQKKVASSPSTKNSKRKGRKKTEKDWVGV